MDELRVPGNRQDEFRRLRDIFESALDQPAAERSRYLERACAGQADLIQQVERMLHADGAYHRVLDGSAFVSVDGPAAGVSFERTTAAWAHSANGIAPHLTAGTIINGRYRVEGIAGEGGMGVVFRVRDDLHPDRPLALKTVRQQHVSPAQLALFKAEFRTMAQLTHPHIAAVYDFEPIQGSADYFYTLDYVDGLNVFDASHHQDWPAILDRLVEVAQALAYIHSRRIAHLDLKPANVLVDHADNVKVLDFGVAAAWARLDQVMMLGTPAYMAPEMFDGRAIDHRADLYALGILAYRLLCRRLPFVASNLAELCGQHRSTPITFSDADRERLPEWLRQAIRKLCAKDPADRYRSAATFIESVNRQGGLAYDVETQHTRDSYLSSTAFVGREQEFTRLSDFCARRVGQEDVSGAPAMWVAGPSGIGKSRLINQVRQQMQLQGIAFLASSCLENTFDDYGPIADLVNHAVRLAAAGGRDSISQRHGSELVKVAPELAVTHGYRPSPPVADAGHERTRVHTAVADFFLAVSDVVPFVACVNDLHWARAGTVDLIGTLLSAIELREKRLGRRVRICCVGSYRSDEVEARPCARLVGRQLTDVIELKPLSREEAGEVIGSMLGIEKLPPAFVARVHSEAAGNPFFVQEIMRALVNSGSVYALGGEWTAREDVPAIDIPTSLTELLERRMAQLPKRERELVTVFAVYGRPLPFTLALQLTGLPDNDLAGLLLDLERKQILLCVDERTMTFGLVHDRLRETYYESLADEVRVQWHGRIAASIERAFASDLDPHHYDLSRHCAAANRSEAALGYSLLGATQARTALAHGTAIEMLERALSLTQDAKQRQQIESDLADEHSLVGGYDRALGFYEGLLARTDDPLHKARFWRGVSTIHFYKGDMQPALDAVWESVRLLGGSVPARGKAGVIVGMLGALAALGTGKLRGFPRPRGSASRVTQLELAATYQRMSTLYYFVFPPGMMLVNLRALLVARPWGPSDQLAQAYAMLAFILGGVLGKHRLARRLSDAALDTVQQVPSTWQDGFVRARIGALAIFHGDYSEAVSQLAEAKRRLQLHGDYAELGFAWVNLSQAYYFQGRFKEGYAIALEGYELFERIGSDMCARQFLSMVAVMGALIGIKGEMGKVRDGIARSELCRDYTCQCIGMVKLGAVHAVLGEYEHALAALEQAETVRSKHGVKFHYADMLDVLDLDIRLKMRSSTSALLGKTLKKNRRIARLRPAYAPWVSLNEANYALSCGKRKEALSHYDRARKLATQQGAKHLLASVHADLARADPGNARTHLQQALALHRECGAVHDEQRIEGALDSLP